MKRRLVVAGLIIAWIVTGAFAPAVPPTPPAPPSARVVHEHISYNFSTTDPGISLAAASCPFPVRIDTIGYGIKHTFFNPNGTTKTLLVQPTTKTTFTNLANGKSLTTPQVNLEITKKDVFGNVTLQTSVGLKRRIVVPGEGLVLADIGRVGFALTYDAYGNFVSWKPISNGIQDGVTVASLCQYLD